jgi:hypothetical protein
MLVFRIDKFVNGQDVTSEADAFRRAITMEPLCALLGSTCPDGAPPGGKTRVFPEIFFSEPFKEIADAMIAANPIAFLKQLHAGVSASQTPPLTPVEQGIADAFEAVYPNLETNPNDFADGAQAAHALILRTYLSHRDRNNWISFLNIGDWGNEFAQRSAITEFLQFGNSHATVAYYHTFWDSDGNPLDGSKRAGYVLKFLRFQIPRAERFWSLTAYTPDAIELIKNPAQKYVVASYDNPVAAPDQSISIFISRTQPPGVPASNWLPVSSRPFNIMLRVYGPEGTVRLGTYVPPAITSLTR